MRWIDSVVRAVREGTPLPPDADWPAPEARAFEFIAIGAAACETAAVR